MNFSRIKLEPDDIDLFVPYYITAAMGATVGVLFLVMYSRFRETKDHPSVNVASAKDYNENGYKFERCKKVRSGIKMLVIALVSIFFFVYIGLEKTVGVLIPAYGHHGPLKLPKKTGADLTALYWAMFTSFRLVGVILSGMIGTVWILVINFTNSVIATITLAAAQNSEPVLWLSCALLGVGLSSTWGSLIGFLQTQFPVNGRIVSCFSLGTCLGASIFPAIVGYLMSIDSQFYVWFCLLFTLMIALLFATIYTVCRYFLNDVDRNISAAQLPTISGSVD